jgi:hypothetical protein
VLVFALVPIPPGYVYAVSAIKGNRDIYTNL